MAGGGALGFLVDNQHVEEMAGIARRIAKLCPAHRPLRLPVLCDMFAGLDAVMPQKLAAEPLFGKVEIIVQGFHADNSADRVQPGSGGEGIANVQIGPGCLHKCGIAGPGLEPQPGQQDAGPGFLTTENTRNPEGAIENLDDHHRDKVIDTNLTAIFNTIKLAARHMKATGGGRIIATSSIAARCNEAIAGTPDMPHQMAVSHLVRHMAMELAAFNIQVNAITPGPFVTNIAGGRLKNPVDRKAFETQTLMGRIAEPDEIKGIALSLASPASSSVTGAEMVIDGGSLLRFSNQHNQERKVSGRIS